MTRRFVTGLVGSLLFLLATAASAWADPPAPTDYRSQVEGLDPAVDGVTARIIGGDSFIELTVTPGLEVLVVGYQGEPYLRFDPDGTVVENQRSPSKPLNDDRFGEGDLTGTDPEAEPVWEQVADGGTHQWHDHRTHWMQPDRPFGKEPGDRILEGVVPLQVDGEDVNVEVSSTWVPAPSRLPALLGAVAGVLVGVAVIRWGRAVVAWPPVLLGASAAALIVGTWQVASVPAATGPPRSAWLLPALASVFAAAAAVLRHRGTSDQVVAALGAVAGIELVVWGWLRREGLWRALLPTDAPWPVDRFVTVVVAVIGVVAAVDLLVRSGLVPVPRRGHVPRPA